MPRPKGSRNVATKEIRVAARKLLSDPSYQKNLLVRLRDGKAPHMETLLHYYAHGKPVETTMIQGDTKGGPVTVKVVHVHQP